MSLTKCIKKAGEFLHADDKAAIHLAAQALRKSGMKPNDAARQAIKDHLAKVSGIREAAEKAQSGVVTQPTEQAKAPPRGTFNPATLTIRLLQDANLSTFLHESAHAFLHITSVMAAQENAPQQIKDDFAKTLKWMGIKGDTVVVGGSKEGSLAQGEWDDPQPDREPPSAAAMADDLRYLAAGAGWAVEGGRMIRSGISEPGDQSNGGFVVGRTPWIPQEEWFGRMRGGLAKAGLSNAKDIQAAVEKAINGEPLKAAEKRTVDWMRVEVQRMRDALWTLDDEELAVNALDSGLSPRDAGDIALTAKASEIDADAVERAAIQHDNDDAAFMAEMRRIVDEHQAAVAGASADESGASAPSAQSVQQPAAEEVAQPQRVKRTPEQVWAGMSLDEQRPYHERYAESWEQYLLEGRAPSLEMRGPFQRFRGWMLNVYGSLKDFLRTRQPVTGGQGEELQQRDPGFDQTQTEAFKRFSKGAPLITSEDALTHQFVNGEPVVVEAFHGTKRPDRVGTKFLKKRATSGPMAFHTSSPELASSYAAGKQDTSLANEDQDYSNWFKVKLPGDRSTTDLVRTWYRLTPEQKERIAALAPRVMFSDEQEDDGGNKIVLGPEGHDSGTGSYDYNLAATRTTWDRRGNPLKALIEDWLNSGNLFDDEERFMQVLKLAGFPMDTVKYDSPHAEYPFVYKNYIAMQQPLVTNDIAGNVIVALQDAAKKDRSRAQTAGADMWDKNTRTLREWVKALTEPTDGSAKYVWTSIPDKVTAVLKSLGYDGIIDWSGKGGGPAALVAPVYIPFEETQVKSAIGNKGNFDTTKNDILKQGESEANPLGLSAEVRGVFDRLLATEQQIAEAEDQARYEAIYKSAEEAGMDEYEWAVYQEMHRAGTDSAIDQMQARSIADMKWAANARSKALKALQAQVKEQREEVKAEVTAEVMASPLERARAIIKERRQSTPEQLAEMAAWKAARQAEVQKSLAAQEALLYEQNPDAKGLEKAQLVSKNKRIFANQAEAAALQWEKDNPRPQPKLPTIEMDLIAEQTGFSSGDELAKAMVEQPEAKDLIAAETENRLRARYGDAHSPAALAQAATEAVHNAARARFIATELATMDAAMTQTEKTGPRTSVNVLVRAAKEFAKALVGRTLIMDLKPSKFTAAETRAAAQVKKNLGKDQAAAVQAQRDRLLNLYAAKEAFKAKDEIDAALKYFARVQKSSTIPASHLDQINAILERFKLRETNADSDNRIKFRTWALLQLKDGEIPPNVEALLSPSARKRLQAELQTTDAQGELVYEDEEDQALLIAQYLDADALRSYKELTVDEIRALRDTVKQIEHLGRRTQAVLSARDKRLFGETRDKLVDGLNANAKESGKLERTSNTWIGRRLDGLKQFGVSHIKPAIWSRIFDGGKDNGVWWSTVIKPANERAAFETSRRADATSKLMAILGPVLKDVPLTDKVGKGRYFPELKTSLNWEERFSILLNMGNASNEQRLMGGGIAGVKQRLTPAEVAVVLKTFTAAELKAAQGVWDHFETYRPEIRDKQLRVEGVEPEWIEPRPFQITSVDGQTVTLKGGYYPVVFDRKGSLKAAQHGAAKEAKDAMKAAYSAATTNRSFTKTRVQLLNGRPLLLNMQGLFSGVNDVIHDLAWHEWVIDMNRFMRDEPIHEAMVDHYGVNVKNQFTKWVNDIVAGQARLDHGAENAVGWARKFVSSSALTYNVMSALIQPLGITQSFSRVGTGWVAQGMSQYLKSPMEATADVRERSEFMRNRTRTMFRDLNELRNRVQGQTTARELMGRYGYFLTMHMQTTVDVPTWLGAYAKAIHEGHSDEDSVGLADQAVKDSQGGGEEVDQAGITRGGPFIKLFTAFYEFMNTQANVLYLATQTKSKPDAFMQFALVGVLTPIFGKMLKDALVPGDSGDWDDWKKAMRTMINEGLSNLIGMVAFGREFAGVVKRITEDGKSMGYSGPTGLRLVSDAEKLMDQAKQGEMDDAFRKAFINMLGDVSGIPSVQLNRTITGAKALHEGQTKNPAAVVFGYQEPH